MKRVIGLLAGLLAVMIGVTGCMNARVSFEQQAISYLEEKYGTSFTWIEPVGGQFGSSEKSGHVSTPDFAGKTLFVTGTAGKPETFRDNYAAYRYNEQACSILNDAAATVEESWRAFCVPEEIGLSESAETDALSYLQNGACMVHLLIGAEDYENTAKIEQFCNALNEQGINANITVYLADGDARANASREEYQNTLPEQYAGRFVMDEQGGFAVSKWR